MEPALQFDVSIFIGMLLSAAVALFGPVVVAVWFRSKTQVPWRPFFIGVATFVIAQIVLRFPWQLPLGVILRPRLNAQPMLAAAWLLFSAFTAGLFEETGRYIAFRRFLKTERSFRVGVMFGLGHGGIEAILLVGLSLFGSAAVYLLLSHGVTLPITPAHQDAMAHQFKSITFPLTLLSGFERAATMCLQVAQSLMVLRAVKLGRRAWFLGSIAVHTFIDATSVEAVKLFGAFGGEAWVAALAMGALAFIFYERKHE